MNLMGEHLTCRMVLVCNQNVWMSISELIKLRFVDIEAMVHDLILDKGSETS